MGCQGWEADQQVIGVGTGKVVGPGPWNPPDNPQEMAEREGQDGWAGAERKAGRWEFSETCGPAAWVKNLKGRSEFGLIVGVWGRNLGSAQEISFICL